MDVRDDCRIQSSRNDIDDAEGVDISHLVDNGYDTPVG